MTTFEVLRARALSDLGGEPIVSIAIDTRGSWFSTFTTADAPLCFGSEPLVVRVPVPSTVRS